MNERGDDGRTRVQEVERADGRTRVLPGGLRPERDWRLPVAVSGLVLVVLAYGAKVHMDDAPRRARVDGLVPVSEGFAPGSGTPDPPKRSAATGAGAQAPREGGRGDGSGRSGPPRWIDGPRFRCGPDWIELRGRLDRPAPLRLTARLTGRDAGGWSTERSFEDRDELRCLLEGIPPIRRGDRGGVEIDVRCRGVSLCQGTLRNGWEFVFEGMARTDTSRPYRIALGPVFVGRWAIAFDEAGVLRGLHMDDLETVPPEARRRFWAYEPSPSPFVPGTAPPPYNGSVGAMVALADGRLLLGVAGDPARLVLLRPEIRRRRWVSAMESRSATSPIRAADGKLLPAIFEVLRQDGPTRLDEGAGEGSMSLGLSGQVRDLVVLGKDRVLLTAGDRTGRLREVDPSRGATLAEERFDDGAWRLTVGTRHVLRWQDGEGADPEVVIHERGGLKELRRLPIGPKALAPWIDEGEGFALQADATGLTRFSLQSGPSRIVAHAGEWRHEVAELSTPVVPYGGRCVVMGSRLDGNVILRTGRLFGLVFSPRNPETMRRIDYSLRPRTGIGAPDFVAFRDGRMDLAFGQSMLGLHVESGRVELDTELFHQPKIPPVFHEGRAYVSDSFRMIRLGLEKPRAERR